MQRYTVILEPTDGEYFAYVPALPGCTSAGRTPGEAIDRIREAIRLTLEYLREQGLEPPTGREMVVEVEA